MNIFVNILATSLLSDNTKFSFIKSLNTEGFMFILSAWWVTLAVSNLGQRYY